MLPKKWSKSIDFTFKTRLNMLYKTRGIVYNVLFPHGVTTNNILYTDSIEVQHFLYLKI